MPLAQRAVQLLQFAWRAVRKLDWTRCTAATGGCGERQWRTRARQQFHRERGDGTDQLRLAGDSALS